MLRPFLISLVPLAVPVPAGADWMPVNGAGIVAALTGRVVQYDDARQAFRASGRTLYTFGGRDSWGYWRIEGDLYCSQWPPSDLWACYVVEVTGNRIRFVGEGGDVTEGRYAD